MVDGRTDVCPVAIAAGLDNRIRRWVQNPRRLLSPYVREGMTVLDVGCGPGFFSTDLARMVGASGHVIAADLQEGMLRKLREKLRGTQIEARVTLHQCQKTRIGVSQHVDFVLAFYVLHELPDQNAFFAEMRDVLDAQGRLLVVEPPFHVSKAAFEATIGRARVAGFALVDKPRMTFNKAALLRRD